MRERQRESCKGFVILASFPPSDKFPFTGCTVAPQLTLCVMVLYTVIALVECLIIMVLQVCVCVCTLLTVLLTKTKAYRCELVP